MKTQKVITLKDFLNKNLKYGDEIIFFRKGEGLFRIQKKGDEYLISDEREKIQVIITKNEIGKLNSLIAKYYEKKQDTKKLKSIEEILAEEVKKGSFKDILGKNFLIYDIETTSYQQDIKQAKFLLAYMAMPSYEEKNGEKKYKFDYKLIADPEYFGNEKNYWKLKKFVDFMIDFDGYIVGFNNIAFDNIVSVYQAGYGGKELEILNQKSIDLFLFFHNLIGKRLSLNKIADALIGIKKTLESGAEVEKLLKKYQETGDKNLLKATKTYCKNDVRMTLMILLYLLYFKKIYREGKEIEFEIEELIKLSNIKTKTQVKDTDTKIKTQSLF